jgi:polyisoprenoid-binding protein YceI
MLGFSGTQTGSKFQGKFSRFDAQIVLDPDHVEGGHITATVDLGSAATGDTQRDTALPGKDWFDTTAHQNAVFTSDAVRKVGTNTYEATGTLTLRGVTRSLTLPFTLEIDGDRARARGHADLVRTTFGVGQGAWASGQWVGLDVGVDLDLTATRSN